MTFLAQSQDHQITNMQFADGLDQFDQCRDAARGIFTTEPTETKSLLGGDMDGELRDEMYADILGDLAIQYMGHNKQYFVVVSTASRNAAQQYPFDDWASWDWNSYRQQAGANSLACAKT